VVGTVWPDAEQTARPRPEAYRAVTFAKGKSSPLLMMGGCAMAIGVVLALNHDSLFGFAGASL
jgi:hypothetical protein